MSYPFTDNNMTNAEYHEHKAIGSTSLKQIVIPAIYKHSQDNPQPYKDVYRQGTNFHYAKLEPEKLKSECLVAPDYPRRSNADKQRWATWFNDHGANGDEIINLPVAEWYPEFNKQTGKNIVTPDELTDLILMNNSINNKPEAISLFTGGEAETSLFWVDSDTGIKLKIRPDYLNKSFCTDLKSTADARANPFACQTTNLGYHISACMYLDGIKQVTGRDVQFRWVAVEKKAPYLCAVYQLSDESMQVGQRLYREYLNKLANCLESDNWPGLENDFDLSLPVWALDDSHEAVTFGGLSL
jgi:PDDEXK-like domain of unknown function (DUF3799)